MEREGRGGGRETKREIKRVGEGETSRPVVLRSKYTSHLSTTVDPLAIPPLFYSTPINHSAVSIYHAKLFNLNLGWVLFFFVCVRKRKY